MKLKHGAFIPARYSTDNQEQDSIEVQIEKCTDWCNRNGIPVLDVFPDYAVSGMKDSRPQFDRMMELLRLGQADTVVLYDQSRMFRKMTAWFQFRDEMEILGVRVVCVTQPMIGGDLRDPSNFLAEGSMALFNQMWVLQTRQKVVEKMRFMARNGQHTGGIPPLGFRIEDGRLAIDPQEAKVVQRIFRMYADGFSYKKILDSLNADGIKTKRGNAFGANSLHDLLKNKKYIGTLVYGKTAQRPNGTRNSHRTSADVIELENACPAIIDRELFDAVQKKMEANRGTGGRPPVIEDFALRGKVFCGDCQAPMNVHYSGGGRKFVYYACSAQKRTHVCQSKPIRVHALESYVAQELRKFLSPPQNRDELLAILREQRDLLRQGAGGRMEAMVSRRKEITAQLENATNAILSGLSSPTLLDKVKSLEAEKSSLDYKIDLLYNDVACASIPDQDMESTLDMIIRGAYSNDSAILTVVYRVEICHDAIHLWTLTDIDPGGSLKSKIELTPGELSVPPDPGFCAELVVPPRLHQRRFSDIFSVSRLTQNIQVTPIRVTFFSAYYYP